MFPFDSDGNSPPNNESLPPRSLKHSALHQLAHFPRTPLSSANSWSSPSNFVLGAPFQSINSSVVSSHRLLLGSRVHLRHCSWILSPLALISCSGSSPDVTGCLSLRRLSDTKHEPDNAQRRNHKSSHAPRVRCKVSPKGNHSRHLGREIAADVTGL